MGKKPISGKRSTDAGAMMNGRLRSGSLSPILANVGMCWRKAKYATMNMSHAMLCGQKR